MNIETIKLIVCDVDGTILPAGKNSLSLRTVEAFHKAKQNGYTILICTGRHYTLIPESFFKDLDMDVIGTINGACLVKRDGTVIEKHPMSKETMEAITDMCKETGTGLGFKFEDAIVTYANYDLFIREYAHNDQERSLIINDDATCSHHEKYGYPLGIFIIGEYEKLLPYVSSMPDLVFAWSVRKGFDVFLKDINKTTAIERVLKDHGWTWDNVIAFGDAGNDTCMIEKAKIGVAMKNARDDVQKYADILADSCENDGVAKMLEQLHIA